MTFAGILLLSHQILFNRKNIKIAWDHIISLSLLGVLAIYVTNIAEIWGIQYMASAKACLIYSLSPFLASLVAYLVLKETLTKKKWLGLLVGFIGLIPILFAHTSPTDLAKNLFLI